jgi:hypothetical protein
VAYAISHFFPGGTKEQYEKTLAAVHASEGNLPPGQLFHAAGPSSGGWTIMAVHDTKESWDRFFHDTLMPAIQRGISGGFAGPPQETTFETHRFMRA